MIKTYFPNLAQPQIKFQKRPTKSVGFFELNHSDKFEKLGKNIDIPFTSSYIDKKKELRQLQHEYLELHFDKKITPEALLGTDGINFLNYLMQEESIDDILKKYLFNFYNPYQVTSVLEREIDGKSVKTIFYEYKSFLIKKNNLIKSIEKLEKEIRKANPGLALLQSNSLDYVQHVSEVTPRKYDPNYSECFRYKTLYPHVRELIEKVVNKTQTSALASALEDNKLKFLVVGLGKNCEELYDYATYAYNPINAKGLKLSDYMDFEMVDFRTFESFTNNYINPPQIPDWSIKNLPVEILDKLIKSPDNDDKLTYPIEVLDLVNDSLENKLKLHSSYPIEDYVNKHNEKSYDFVSINNVLQYPGVGENSTPEQIQKLAERYRFLNPLLHKTFQDSNKFDDYKKLLRKIGALVKPGGFLSCKIDGIGQVKMDNQIEWAGLTDQFYKIEPGLYKRKAQEADSNEFLQIKLKARIY